jgi:hypothetical protein
MRRLTLLLLIASLAESLSAESSITVRQLEDFLLSPQATRQTDRELARRLSFVHLSEQLTEVRLKLLRSRLRIGPGAAEQLELLAFSSEFETPPAAELPSRLPPDLHEQERILESAKKTAAAAVIELPNFIALRSTRSFDDAPQFSGKNHAKPDIALHFARESDRLITVRAGQEVTIPPGSGQEPSRAEPSNGLTTSGEFGYLLATVLEDSHNGTVAWSRWQAGLNGQPLAVFRYSVPKSASHNLINFCCYATFRDRPPYHGDLYIDPTSGTILRVTLEAELNKDAPVRTAKLSVDYDEVEIGGKNYICPVHGIAVSTVYDVEMEQLDGVGLERFINVVRFTDYHKFGSTARILTTTEP